LILPDNVKKDKTVFSKAERALIDAAAANREEAKLVKMMNNTGMRIGELFTLETDKVFDNYCIGGEKTEAGRNRIIPIPKEVRPEFAHFRQKAQAAGGERLIDGYDGKKVAAYMQTHIRDDGEARRHGTGSAAKDPRTRPIFHHGK
jgi:integrase